MKLESQMPDMLEFASLSDIGQQRQRNEDALLASPESGLAIVADGLGGGKAGEVASQAAVNILAAALPPIAEQMKEVLAEMCGSDEQEGTKSLREALSAEISKANAAIYNAAQSKSSLSGMATTLVLAMFGDRRMISAHIGDSRLYRLRDNKLKLLTYDHTMHQAMVDVGLEQEFRQPRSLLLRALGSNIEVEAEINIHRLQRGDLYILCTDGLTDMVSEDSILATLNNSAPSIATGRFNLGYIARNLVQLANAAGGHDNISLVLVSVLEAE